MGRSGFIDVRSAPMMMAIGREVTLA